MGRKMKRLAKKTADLLIAALVTGILASPFTAYAAGNGETSVPDTGVEVTSGAELLGDEEEPPSPEEIEENGEIDFITKSKIDWDEIEARNDQAAPEGMAKIAEMIDSKGVVATSSTYYYKNGTIEVDTMTGPTGIIPDPEEPEDPNGHDAAVTFTGLESENANAGTENAIQKAIQASLYNLFAAVGTDAQSLTIRVCIPETSISIIRRSSAR